MSLAKHTPLGADGAPACCSCWTLWRPPARSVEVKRSLVLIAAVDEPVVVVGEPGVTVVELFVPGRTVAIAAASDPGGLVAVEEGIWSPSNACTDTISTCDCSDGGENAVWRGLCVHVYRER